MQRIEIADVPEVGNKILTDLGRKKLEDGEHCSLCQSLTENLRYEKLEGLHMITAHT